MCVRVCVCVCVKLRLSLLMYRATLVLQGIPSVKDGCRGKWSVPRGHRARAPWDGCGGTAELTVELFPGLLLSDFCCLVCFKCWPPKIFFYVFLSNFLIFSYWELLGFRCRHRSNTQTRIHKKTHRHTRTTFAHIYVHVVILDAESLGDSDIVVTLQDFTFSGLLVK